VRAFRICCPSTPIVVSSQGGMLERARMGGMTLV
jgi:hypothetical protein